MPKLRFDRFMVSEHTNRIFSRDKEQTVSETSRIYFVDNSYGFTHNVSEYDTKLNLQEKTYEISKEQRHQMDLAVLTMRQLETDALRNKDTVLYFTTLDRRYVVINHSDNYNLLTIEVKGPHVTLYGQETVSTKDRSTVDVTQAIYEYLKRGYVLTRTPFRDGYYRKEELEVI